MFQGMKGREASLHTPQVSQANLIKGGDIMEHVQEQGFQRSKVSVREMVKNQKGLTLIELLAVIVILAIIAAIAIPSISAIIRNTERNAHISNAHQMVDAARLYVATHGYTGDSMDITHQQLVEKGFLNALIKDPYNKATTYDPTASKVNVKINNKTDAGVTTSTVVYSITLHAMGSGTTAGHAYYNNTTEDKIDTAFVEPNTTPVNPNP